MQKYTTQLLITTRDGATENMRHFRFWLRPTAFIAVTAYQSGKIRQLKIDMNPNAKTLSTPAIIEHNTIEQNMIYSMQYTSSCVSHTRSNRRQRSWIYATSGKFLFAINSPPGHFISTCKTQYTK